MLRLRLSRFATQRAWSEVRAYRNSRDSSLRPIAAGMTLPMTQSQFSLYCVEFAAPGTSIAHAAVSKIFEAEEKVKLDVLCEAVKDVGEKYWSKIQFKRGEHGAASDVMHIAYTGMRREEVPIQIFPQLPEPPIHQAVAKGQSLRLPFKISEDEMRFLLEFHNAPIELQPDEENPARRVAIVQYENGKVGLHVLANHMLEDGTSLPAVLRLIQYQYNVRLGRTDSLPDRKPQELLPYSVFVDHELRYLRSSQYETDKKFWMEKLDGTSPVGTDLFGGVYQEGAVHDLKDSKSKFEAEFCTYSIPSNVDYMQMAKTYCQERKISYFQAYLAAYYWALHLATGKSDLMVSTTFHGRMEQDLKRVNGNCINILPLRQEVSGDMTFDQLVEQVRSNVRSSKRHGQFPFDELQGKQAVLEYMLASYELPTDMVVVDHDSTINPCTIRVHPREEATEVYVAYQKNVLTQSSVDALVQLWLQVFKDAVQNPHKKLSELDVLAKDQKQAILRNSHGPELPSIGSPRYDDLFEMGLVEDGRPKPEGSKIAVRCGAETLTYADLRSLSDRIASLLSKHDSKVVAIHMPEKRALMIPLLLGVLKADAVFMPLDSSLPLSRMDTMMQNCGARLVVTSDEKTFDGLEGVTVLSTKELEAVAKGMQSVSTLANKGTSEDLSYILHTSGTTGVPKAVPIRHSSLVNYCRSVIQYYGLTSDSCMLQCSAEGFDIFVEEVFPTLLAGGCIDMVPKQVLLSEETLRRVLKEDAVTHLTVSTSLFHAVSDFSLPGLRTVITGGEKLKKPQYERFQRKHPDTCIFNTYGPTETTVIASLHKCELNEGRDLPIGKPIHGTSIYVAKGVQLCPVGVAGEVYIGGAGVSPGYLGAEANNEAFQKDLSDGSRYMFRTGDLARWLPDGNLEFVSRVGKGQVKIRGFRVEIGDVTRTLLEAEGLNDCYVLPVTRTSDGDSSEMALVAFIVMDEGHPGTESDALARLRRYAASKLPAYMVPSSFIPMERLPLTAFGKIDERSLKDIYSHTLQTRQNATLETHRGEAPSAGRTDAEREMLCIWQDVLGVEDIGIDDNFFELGGTSFQALQVATRAKGAFEVMELFQTPTIRELMGSSAAQLSYLVPLRRPSRPRKLAFCLPGFGGNARALGEAADGIFSADAAVFGLRPKGMVNVAADPPLEDLDDMIRHTTSVIQQAIADSGLDPENITLLGYSAGTLLALGVADALKTAVTKVVLVAPGSPTYLPADNVAQKTESMYQDIRYTSLLLSLFLQPQDQDVIGLAESIQTKADLMKVLSHAGIDAATVEPLLPYFAARYKTQKDLNIGELTCGSRADILVVKCEGDDYTGFDQLVAKNGLKVQTQWCPRDHFEVLTAPSEEWQQVRSFLSPAAPAALGSSAASLLSEDGPYLWGGVPEERARPSFAQPWSQTSRIR